MDSIRRRDSSSPLEEHAGECHPDEERDFSMEIISFINSPLIRQISEAVHIQDLGQKAHILNRKGEWGQNLPPKILIEGRGNQKPPPPPRQESSQMKTYKLKLILMISGWMVLEGWKAWCQRQERSQEMGV